MKDLYFFIYHGSILVLLGILPYILASFNQKPLEILFIVTAILGIELFVIGLTNIISRPAAKVLRGFWGAILGLAGIISIVQVSFFLQSNGSLLNWQLLQYAVTHTEYIAPIISNEISLIWWLRFLIVIPIVYMFSHSGFAATRDQNNHRKTLSVICLFFATLLLSGQTGLAVAYSLSQSREDKTPQDTVYNHANKATLHNMISARASDNKKYNIVIVILESIRADATTVHSPHLDTTPFLNSLANTGLVAEHGYVVVPHTSKAVTAILCGHPPDIHNTSIAGTGPEGFTFPCLPELLKPLEYTSAFFQTATQKFEKRDKLIPNMGFDHFAPKEKIPQKHWETVNYFGYEDKAMIQPAMEWVDKQDTPFLLSLLTLTSHHYYKVPSTFSKRDHVSERLFNDYLNTVKYTDDFLHDLWKEFETRNLLDETIFVFVSDHGERFDGNKAIGHHQTMEQQAIQIPIVVWNPTLIPSKQVATGPRQPTDVVPTILDLLRVETNNTSLPGTSLKESVENRPIYIACTFGSCFGRISGNHKFVYDGTSKYELYDVISDPEEEKDLSTSTNFSDDQARQYIKEIESWRQYAKTLYN